MVTLSPTCVTQAQTLIQRVRDRRDNSRRAIRRSVNALHGSLEIIGRAADDGLPFIHRNTTFGAMGAQLDCACRELAVGDEILTDLEDLALV